MKVPTNTSDLSIVREFSGARLGNKGRTKRLARIAERLEAQPGKSLPQALGSIADREAGYRFLNNEDVSFDAVLAAHIEASGKRVDQHGGVVCIHDTTDLEFDSPALHRGLGRLRGKKSAQGFRAHVSLAVALSEPREPMGLLAAAQPWTRTEQVRAMRKQAGRTEMDVWFEGAARCEERCQSSRRSMTWMSGDSYALYSQLHAEQMRFVVRACHDRQLPDGGKLFATVEQSPLRATRSVPLSRRMANRWLKQKQIYPERRSRLADLSIRAMTVPVSRARSVSHRLPSQLALNIVYILEDNPPEG